MAILVCMREFCRRILGCGDLATKLAPAPGVFEPVGDGPSPPARPARDASLAMDSGAPRLPRPSQLGDRDARARCLARFAHHELMAVELFAWALLRWPALPEAMQRGMLGILEEEQLHCRLYLERLAENGSALSEHPRSDYFWKHVPAITASAAGYSAFLAAVGLTFEQGNLDFAPLYAAGFRTAGDEQSARVCERVHRDEIGHVRFAATALRAHAADGGEPLSDIALYERAVPFPLCAARAKGRSFDAKARQEAGLSEEFVEYVRNARPPQELRANQQP